MITCISKYKGDWKAASRNPYPRKNLLRDGLKRRSMGGMKSATCLCTLLLFLQQSNGCDSSQKTAPSVAKEIHLPPLHRFVNVSSPPSPGVALDTVTGQYCKTWDWTYKAKSMDGGMDMLPTCLSIFHGNPAQADPTDPLRLFQPSPK